MINLEDKRVMVTGGYGFFGKHVTMALVRMGVKPDIFHSSEYDLRDYDQTWEAFREYRPEYVIHMAAKVGGIGANQKRPADFWQENLEIGLNVLRLSHETRVQKIVVLGSVCCYPKFPKTIPFVERELFEGYPEHTNAPYGIAKLALYVGAEAYHQQHGLNYTFVIPTNLYGMGDNFSLETGHVIPALIRRIYNAKKNGLQSLTLWGTGKASRCFLYAEDGAEGVVKALQSDYRGAVNLASKDVITIEELANLICDILDYKGSIEWDLAKPDGQPVRSVDTSIAQAAFSFVAKTPFETGLRKTIEWYLENLK